MTIQAPHFLLTAQCRRRNRTGDWQFVLEGARGEKLLEVAEAEPAVGGERLELLAVVRGLEALDQPSRVTLRTPSTYVTRGLKYGLDDWRSNNWQWESHGRMVPMKNADLWRRLDRALGYHEVQCIYHRFDAAHEPQMQKAEGRKQNDGGLAGSRKARATTTEPAIDKVATARRAASVTHTVNITRRRAIPAICRWWRECCSTARLRLARLGTGVLPRPWFD